MRKSNRSVGCVSFVECIVLMRVVGEYKPSLFVEESKLVVSGRVSSIVSGLAIARDGKIWGPIQSHGLVISLRCV